MKEVLFFRDFKKFQGGHLKVWDYFNHVRSSPDHVPRVRFSPGSVIVRQGEEGDSFYVVASGTVDVEVEDGGTSEVVATLGEGDFFGEVALVKDEPRNATITATTPLVVYALPRDHFQRAIEEGPSFKEQVLGDMLHRTR